MGMPNDLVLVRHGESEGNVASHHSKKGDDRHYTDEFLLRHSSKWRLTDKGIEQAKAAGDWIKTNIGEEFFRYYTSEYLRAEETSAYLNLPRANWYPEFYLRERDWGLLDVMTHAKRMEAHAEALKKRDIDSFYWSPPNGESMAQLCLRVDRTIDTFHRECEGKPVIVVCHGEVMWAYRMRLERMSLEYYHQLDKSREPLDRIHNCQILHYTRVNPNNPEEVAPYLKWMRSSCPWDISLSSHEWVEITRSGLSNAQLLERAEQYPRLVNS
jgi:NAD+ kinase